MKHESVADSRARISARTWEACIGMIDRLVPSRPSSQGSGSSSAGHGTHQGAIVALVNGWIRVRAHVCLLCMYHPSINRPIASRIVSCGDHEE